VKFGVMVPFLVPTTREPALAWCRGIDEGPFESLLIGERVTYHNVEQTVMLAAAAAATSRVRLYTHILIAPMHPYPLLAKRLASIDMLSGGRLTVSVGTGGRDHDYHAAGSPTGRRHQRLDECVAELRRLWAGGAPFPGGDPIGPRPAQPGGPPIFTSARAPKAIARATKWASGFTGAALRGVPADMAAEANNFLYHWKAAGGTGRPYMMTSLFFAVGDDAEERMYRITERYLTVGKFRPPPELVQSLLSQVTSEDGIKRAADGAEAAGFDELVYITTTDDVRALDALANVIAKR
jgi:alkanesulfonate monooxygenase SsuD/methylene tetrahydromethanopterin reductase-like flavin-dependent oxidoreductase (luciferase family)